MVTKIDVIKQQKLKNPVMLVGLPGIGLVGKIAIDYLVSELQPKSNVYATIVSDTFPPAVHAKSSLLELISDKIYLYKGKSRDFLFVAGPVQPNLTNLSNSQEHYEFSAKLAEFAKKQGVKEIYTFAGLNIGEKRLNQKPRVLAVSSDKDTKERLRKKKIKNIIFDDTQGNTLISGVAGLLVGVAYYNHKISGCCFMGETDQKLIFGDQGSARSVVGAICALFDFKVDMKKIDIKAKKIEESFKEIQKEIKEIAKKKEEPVSYIR
ncbi:MAG TPA: PAC2 family protein [Candidatus Diapherotrites archaeon]|jgi:proteasome assembly chaperone (PAC2) family protein|nr:PAC2 family protein [Candidatus Diapherotrites archaeon]